MTSRHDTAAISTAGATAAALHDAPVVHGNHTLAPNLAYQAEDRMMMTMQALGDAARVDDPDQLRTALTEARLHISAADGHLDLMELHLEQTARQIPPRRPPTRPHLELDLD